MLQWKGNDATSTKHHISSGRWLQTAEAATRMSSSIMTTTRFSLCAAVSASANFRPEWFARIVAVLADPYHQNFSLVQIDDNLGVRFRSMTTGVNGTNPQFIVPDVFTDTLMHRIVVTLNSTHLQVYIDSMQRHYELDLGPGFALLNRFFPSRGRLNLATRMKDFHNYLFAAFVFIPLGYILGAMVRHMRRGFFLRLATAVVGIAAAPLLMEWKLQQLTGRGLSINNLWIGCTLILATLILTVCWPRKIQTSVEGPA
jgi:hypothetical protein